MGQRHTFRRIRDQVSRHQRIFHTDMSHGNTVAHRDRRKDYRHTAGLCHTKLHGINDLIQVHMARNDFIVGTYDADHRLCHLFFRKAECIE